MSGLVRGPAESGVLQKTAHGGAGQQKRGKPGPHAGGAGALADILEKQLKPTLSAFPLQGEKGAAGSPGLLGLLGQKVGIN